MSETSPSQPRSSPWLLTAGIVVLLVAALLPSRWPTADDTPGETTRIVCTFLPSYVFALNVTAGVPDVAVEMMVDPNVGCPHDYALRARDRSLLEQADVIVANGLGVEGFIEQVLERYADRVIVLGEACELIPRRGAEPAESGGGHHDHASHDDHENHDAEAAQAAGHVHDEHCDHANESATKATLAYDAMPSAHDGHICDDPTHHHHHHGHAASPWNPHVWVSITEAMTQVRVLTDALSRRDPMHAEQYQANAKAYLDRLKQLRIEYESAAGTLTRRNIVTLHDAFDYLARDMGLNVVTTLERLPGVASSSGDLEAINREIHEHDVAAIFTEPAYSDRLARTVSRGTGVPMATLNPFTSYGESTIPPDAYEKVMRQNLDVLKRTLGSQP